MPDRDEEEEGRDLEPEEVDELFARLFPNGPAGQDVVLELAPDGWEASPLRALYLQSDVTAGLPLPRLTTGAVGKVEDGVVDLEVEVRQLIGLAVWDVFSHNHDVVAPDGRLVNLGTFRDSAQHTLEWIESFIGYQVYDYMFFYGGLDPRLEAVVDLSALYRLVFRRLRALGCRWRHDPDYVTPGLMRAYAEG